MGVPLSLTCFLILQLAATVRALPDAGSISSTTKLSLQSTAVSVFHRILPRVSLGKFGIWEMVACSSLPLFMFWWVQRRWKENSASLASTEETNHGASKGRNMNGSTDTEAEANDPQLLKKHSKIQTYTTSQFTYKNIRVFFREHPQYEKLPTTPAPLPLLVFIHGLGGSVAQFNPLLSSLINLASCLAIDLPGCGLSEFNEKDWDAYKIENLAELVGLAIAEHRAPRQGVVLIGHSLGCSIAALVASKTSISPNPVSEHIIGIVAICPRAEPPTEKEVAMFNKLLFIPSPVFDLWRRWDRRGGKDSASVQRFVGSDADEETKLLQCRFNEQSRTPVWRRMASGTLPRYRNGIPKGGIPGRDIWAGIKMPVFLIAGEADHVTKPENIEKISEFLGKGPISQDQLSKESQPILVDAAARVDTGSTQTLPVKPVNKRSISSIRAEDFLEHEEANLEDPNFEDPHEDPSTPTESLAIIPPQETKPKKTLKTTILPSPASHAMLYQSATVRILAGLISNFLAKQISPRLDLGWQLQYLSTSGKWDVKNLVKWQAVNPVSEPIHSVFRAMKTLREVDPSHSPLIFVKDWGSQIKNIVDISHEAPVYDPKGLEKGGIRYHKFPTVSKIPPTEAEVDEFILFIDKVREEQKARAAEEGWDMKDIYIGVHCHYGFNRTGFFLVSYLKERCGFTLEGAIDEFAKKRPKGIKHAHFLDTLYVRYCHGLKRAPTI